MAETAPSSNNKSVAFGIKKPKREYVRKLSRKLSRGKRKAVRNLQARGMISEDARKRKMP